ncbi:hypothetical protein AS026_15915 [Rhizobium altiplani]|uniref:Uncharacterized protein n=2 Tax=Rhizobium TaxID=379 RepID=K0Q6T2_9HYPH|nr:hypothetical protein AS026_15915 [Rhizobium altiplani]CCM80404.1 hypothetical protein BN77_p290007 [Rhizobium mesoamericanum STM3625]
MPASTCSDVLEQRSGAHHQYTSQRIWGLNHQKRCARLVLLQNADDLFVCETIALHSLVLSMGQSLLQNGLFQRGKVKDLVQIVGNKTRHLPAFVSIGYAQERLIHASGVHYLNR